MSLNAEIMHSKIAPCPREANDSCWNYSYCGHVPGTTGITAFVRIESNTSVGVPTSERQPTAVVIRPYGVHKTVYIGGLCPT
jgi:hypothetical protein